MQGKVQMIALKSKGGTNPDSIEPGGINIKQVNSYFLQNWYK